MTISSAQFRVACELSELSHEDLADQSGVPLRAILALDAVETVSAHQARAIQRVFEQHGILFTRTGVGFG